MLTTKTIEIELPLKNSGAAIAMQLNKELECILSNGGKLIAYTLLFDFFDRKLRSTAFIATFEDLNQNPGVGAQGHSTIPGN